MKMTTQKKVKRFIHILIAAVICIVAFRYTKPYYLLQYQIHQDDLIIANVDFERQSIGDDILKGQYQIPEDSWSMDMGYSYGKNTINTLVYSKRMWVDKARYVSYNLRNTFYQGQVIKQEYTFEKPFHLINVYEQLKNIYGTPTNDHEIMDQLKKYMFGKTHSGDAYARKESPPSYISLYEWDMPEYTVLFRLEDLYKLGNANELEVILEIKPEILEAKINAIKENAVHKLDELKLMGVDPFYEGFSRGKIVDHWVLLNANTGKITEYQDRDVYDYSYAKQGIVILCYKAEETYFGTFYQFVSTDGKVLVDHVTGYRRTHAGEKVQITAVELQGDTYIEKKFQLYMTGDKVELVGVKEFEQMVTEIPESQTFNEQNAFLKDVPDSNLKIHNNLILYKDGKRPDTIFYDMSGNFIDGIVYYGGLYSNLFYKNPNERIDEEFTRFVSRQGSELPRFLDANKYTVQTSVDLSESYIYMRRLEGMVIYSPDQEVYSYPYNIAIEFMKMSNTLNGPLFCVEDTNSKLYNVMTLEGELLMTWSNDVIERAITEEYILGQGQVKDMSGKVMVEVPPDAQWVGDHLFIYKSESGGYRVTDWNGDPIFNQYQQIF